MSWLPRLGRSPSTLEAAPEAMSGPLERSTPGIAALLNGVSEDRSHAVLDLGRAADSSLRIYGRFAQRIRFADLLGSLPGGWGAALSAVPPQPERPYDLVFAWDTLDRLLPEARPRLLEHLVQLTSDDARLHVLVESSEQRFQQPFRFRLLDVDRISCEPEGSPRPAPTRLLPAEVERLLDPFEVVRAFTLKGGLREYVAVRGG